MQNFKRLQPWAAPAALALLLVLSLTGVLAGALDVVGLEQVRQADREHLAAATATASASFLAVSALKAGLAVVSGTTVGFSLGAAGEVAIGDVVQALADYVDVVWRALFAALAALWALRVLLALATDLGPLLTSLALCAVLASVLIARLGRPQALLRGLSVSVCALLITGALLLHLGLPLALRGAAALSAAYTAPARAEADAALGRYAQTLLPPEAAGATVKERVEGLLAYLARLGSGLAELTRELAAVCVKLVAAWLFDVLLFPVGCLLALWWLVRTVVRQVVEDLRLRRHAELAPGVPPARGAPG